MSASAARKARKVAERTARKAQRGASRAVCRTPPLFEIVAPDPPRLAPSFQIGEAVGAEHDLSARAIAHVVTVLGPPIAPRKSLIVARPLDARRALVQFFDLERYASELEATGRGRIAAAVRVPVGEAAFRTLMMSERDTFQTGQLYWPPGPVALSGTRGIG